jgi:hypothetical protein
MRNTLAEEICANTHAEEILLSNREGVLKKTIVTKIPKPHQSRLDIDPTSLRPSKIEFIWLIFNSRIRKRFAYHCN